MRTWCPGGRFREIYYWDSYFTMLGLLETGRHRPREGHARQLRVPRRPPSATFPTATAPTTSAEASRPSSGPWWRCTRTGRPGRAPCPTCGPRDGARVLDGGIGTRSRPPRHIAGSCGCRTAPCSTATGTIRRSRAPSPTARTSRLAAARARRRADGRLSEPARGGRERLGLLEPLDARSAGPRDDRHDRPPSGRPERAALSGRAHDRRVAATPSRTRRCRRGRPLHRAGRRATTALVDAAYDPDTGFFYDVRWRTGERVVDRPTMADAAIPVLRSGVARSRARRSPTRLGRDFLAPGGFVTTTDSVGPAVGRAQWMGSARVDGALTASTATGMPTWPRERPALARTQPPHLSRRPAR